MTTTGASPTPQSLLARLRSAQDRVAWSNFVELYSGLIRVWVQRLGAKPSQADDVTQDVFVRLAKEMPTFDYDPLAPVPHVAAALLLLRAD